MIALSGALCYLVTVVLFGILGGWLAKQAGLPTLLGVVVGAVFSFVGCTFLAGVWLAEWIIATYGNPAR